MEPTMISAEALEDWQSDSRAFAAMETLHDAYERLVAAVDLRVNVTGWRLRSNDVDIVSALKEKGKVPPAWEDVLSAQRWLDAAWATWTAAIADVDDLLAERKLDREREGGE